jgi:hypothetical protein
MLKAPLPFGKGKKTFKFQQEQIKRLNIILKTIHTKPLKVSVAAPLGRRGVGVRLK